MRLAASAPIAYSATFGQFVIQILDMVSTERAGRTSKNISSGRRLIQISSVLSIRCCDCCNAAILPILGLNAGKTRALRNFAFWPIL